MTTMSSADREDGAICLPAEQIASVMQDVHRFVGDPLHALSIAEARAGLKRRRRARPVFSNAFIDIQDVAAAPAPGLLASRVYRPQDRQGPGQIIYCHGGGWVMGKPSDFDAVCARIALSSGSVLISPDYRLAPEWPYPAALNDILSAMQNIGTEDVFALVGESAGANLALAAALAARDRHQPMPACIALFYPVLDVISASTDRDSSFLSAADVTWCWRHYLSSPASVDDYAMPGRIANLQGLSPTLIVHGSVDPTGPATRAFVSRARRAGQDITERYYEGLPHAFTGLLQHDVVGRIIDDVSVWLAARLSDANGV